MRLSLLLALALAGQSLIAVGELLDAAKLSHCGPDCPHSGATARLAASLRGTGAHRTLVYSLDVSCSSTHDAGGSQQGAAAAAAPQAALLQPLPPAVFADIYQLDNAAALGQGPAVKLFGPVDVESIERYSRPTLLAVYSGALAGGGSAAAAAEEAVPGSACGSATLEVPLHARYPHPSQPGQQREGALPGWLQAAQSAAAAAELPAPTVLVQCPSGGDAAEWQAAELQSSPAAASVRWDMPAGNLRHGPLVAIGTAAAVGCGVAAVLRALLAPVAAQAQRRQPRQKRQ